MDEYKIKKGDFIEMDFDGRISSNDQVFDTTREKTAKDAGLYSKDIKYRPYVICVGEGHVLKALDEFVEGKSLGSYSVELLPEMAFGKKSAKLLQLIAVREFHKHEINPVPGLEVELDGQKGIVRSVNGGRVIVDFNHPLASQDLRYDIIINRIIEDEQQKVEGLLNAFKLPCQKVELLGEKAILHFGMDIPEEVKKPITDEILRLTKVKEVEFK